MPKALMLKGSHSTKRESHSLLYMCDTLRSDGPSVGVWGRGEVGRKWHQEDA